MLVDSSGSRNPPARPMATHVAVPGLAAAPGREAQRTRVGQRLAVEARQQLRGRFVVADEVAAVDVAVAHAVLQRNAPLPAGLARRGARVRRERPDVLAGHGHGAIAGQPVRPFVVAGLERLLDEQAAKARAVDEQVAGDRPRRLSSFTDSIQPSVAAQLARRRSCRRCAARRAARRSRAGRPRTARRRTGRHSRTWTAPRVGSSDGSANLFMRDATMGSE